MLQQDDQQRQKQILTSDIRLLEKKRRELLEDIERIDASQKEEYRQFTLEMKERTKRRNELAEQIERSRDTLTTLTDAYNKSKEGMDKYVTEHLDTAHKEADSIIASAKRIETQALDRHNEAALLQKENDARKTQLDRHKELLDAQRREIEAETIALDTRRLADQKSQQLHEEALHKLQQTIRELENEILSLNQTKEGLIVEIGEAKQASSKELHEAREKNLKADQLLISLNQRSRTIAEQELFITEQTRLLKDRQETFDRAVKEYRQKGVSI